MEKKTNIFGFDRTPRKALWEEIARLNKQIVIQERHLTEQQRVEDELRKELWCTQKELLQVQNANEALQSQLDRNARAKDKRGRFIKHK